MDATLHGYHSALRQNWAPNNAGGSAELQGTVPPPKIDEAPTFDQYGKLAQLFLISSFFQISIIGLVFSASECTQIKISPSHLRSYPRINAWSDIDAPFRPPRTSVSAVSGDRGLGVDEVVVLGISVLGSGSPPTSHDPRPTRH